MKNIISILICIFFLSVSSSINANELSLKKESPTQELSVQESSTLNTSVIGDSLASKEKQTSLGRGFALLGAMFPVTLINLSSFASGFDMGTPRTISGAIFSLPQLVSSFFLGYFSKTDRFEMRWSAGVNMTTYFEGCQYTAGLHGGVYSGFRIIKGLSAGFEFGLLTSQDIQIYTPYTIAYTFDITEKQSIFASVGIGSSFHLYKTSPNFMSYWYSPFYQWYPLGKGTIGYEGEKHSIYLSLFFDEFFNDETLVNPKTLGIGYGRKF